MRQNVAIVVLSVFLGVAVWFGWFGEEEDLVFEFEIVSVADPDGLTSLLDFIGDDALMSLLAAGEAEFFAQLTRINITSGPDQGMPARFTLQLWNDSSKSQILGTGAITSIPPNPFPNFTNFISLGDAPPDPPELAGLQAVIGHAVAPPGAPGPVVYTWEVRIVANKRLAIVAAMEATVNGISVANGYNRDYAKHHRKVGEWGELRGSFPAIAWTPGDNSYENGGDAGVGGRTARLRMTVFGYYRRESPDTSDESSLVLKDIERAVKRAENGEAPDVQHLSVAGVERVEWIGTKNDPYWFDPYEMGRVVVEFFVLYVEKSSEIRDA